MKIANAKKQIKKATKKEEKEIKYLIRDFYELKKIFKLINEAEALKGKPEFEEKIKNILKHLKRGLFGSEERIEYRMARTYKQMKQLLTETEPILTKLSPTEVKGIKKLLEQAEMYNADLEMLGARGGEIEKKLKQAQKKPEELKKVFEGIKKALRDVKAFEEITNQLLHKTKNLLAEFEKIKYKKISKQENASIEITGFDGSTHEDGEEYWINIDITGNIGDEPFDLGKNDEDVRITGAEEFFDNDQLIGKLERLKAGGILAKYDAHKQEYITKLILQKIKTDAKWLGKLEELRKECNETAEEMIESNRKQFEEEW